MQNLFQFILFTYQFLFINISIYSITNLLYQYFVAVFFVEIINNSTCQLESNKQIQNRIY